MIKVIIEVCKLPFWSIPSNMSPHFLQILISHDQHPSTILSSSTNHLCSRIIQIGHALSHDKMWPAYI